MDDPIFLAPARLSSRLLESCLGSSFRIKCPYGTFLLIVGHQHYRTSQLVSEALSFGWKKDHRLFPIAFDGTELLFFYFIYLQAMSKDNVMMLSPFVVVNLLIILRFVVFLNVWFYQRIRSMRIYCFGLSNNLNFCHWLPCMFCINFCISIRLF